jgi:hypothetical protein
MELSHISPRIHANGNIIQNSLNTKISEYFILQIIYLFFLLLV